jgi:tRNA pseudouridine38-40 synthase
MPRYRLTLEYDGGALVGWQRQRNGLSVQEVLETAVERYCGSAVTVHGAGRTDAGVHALGQVAHLDLPRAADPDVIRNALNFHMKPHAVAVLEAAPASERFDARRSARARHYRYRILNRRAPAVVDRGRVWHVGAPLDAAAMHEAAQLLVGRHDFSSFRDTLCQAKSPVKTLDRLDVTRLGDEIEIAARARSFLHHQVRNMVGTLKLVGAGKWQVADVARALAARDRRAGGPTAPPEGLYLVAVLYDEARSGEAASGHAEGDVEAGADEGAVVPL